VTHESSNSRYYLCANSKGLPRLLPRQPLSSLRLPLATHPRFKPPSGLDIKSKSRLSAAFAFYCPEGDLNPHTSRH
jgi:hypothetical protein